MDYVDPSPFSDGPSERGKRRKSTRLPRRCRSTSGDRLPASKRRRSRRRMDHVMNYAFQACSSNEERQSLQAAAVQQWMHSNPQFTMPKVPPYSNTTPSPLQPPAQPPMQQFAEGQRPVVGACTGKRASKTTEAQARFAGAMQKPFNLMHCWKYLKDEPKWQETIAGQSKAIDVEDDCYVTSAGSSNQIDTEGDTLTPSSGGTKRLLGRDTTKEGTKRSVSSSKSAASTDYVSKMLDLWVDRFSFMKESQIEKNKHLAKMVALEKEKFDRQVELEERRLALDAMRLAMEERAEEERVMNIDLDTCKPSLRLFYKTQQDKILAKYLAPPS